MKKKMTSLFLTAALTCSMAASLAGCGQVSPAEGEVPDAVSSEAEDIFKRVIDLEGRSLADCRMAISEFDVSVDSAKTNRQVDHDIWELNFLECNSGYIREENSINIFLGILDKPFYYDGMSYEEMLGGIGTVIGHEISHAFDTNGAQYGKNGAFMNWWTEEDYKAFQDRADKLIAYYDNITVFEGQNAVGKIIQGEATADMAGVKAMLLLAEKQEGFDYEKFFETFATEWRRLNTREFEFYMVNQNPHPPHYLRTNVTLQQFDEFLETYDIREGDNMYLAPEDRVKVW